MVDVGFATMGALPVTLSPHDWIVGAIEATVADRVPAESEPLTVGLLGAQGYPPSGEEAARPILALELPVDGAMIVALQPALAALRSKSAAIAACAIVNRTLFLMGPDQMFYEVSSHYWQGEEDELSVEKEYAAQGDEYGGITRAQWDHVYPEWTRRCSRRDYREGKLALRSIAAGRGRARNLACALLALDVATKAASGHKFAVNLAEAIGLDSCAAWGVPLIWSREENLTAMVLDEMYQLAMQTSCDMSVVAMQFPAPTDLVAMRSFRKAFSAALTEFAAASAVCMAMRQLEKD
jgi:PRTRC genetic system protein F